MKNLFIISSLILLFNSCTKEITIDLPEPEKKIVVDGGIFVGQPAEINLTWSTGYFDPIDSASLANYLISSATVYVTDGSLTDTLHISYDPAKPIPIVWKGSTLLGQVGHTYNLTVIADGKTATSTTTIRPAVALDSTWFKLEPPNDSLGFAWAHLTDPVGIGNGYRWFSKRITKDPYFMAPFGSAFDDKFIEGTSFDFAYNRPSNPGSTAPEDTGPQAGYYIIGDTIVVRFCSIGQAEVNFFRTYEAAVASNGNPFAAPNVIKTNVNNGLGIFCGYSPTYDTIICR
ncbi:MAG TPA: DUF4249 domain-containing protein [Bacteroidia bacterium]|nr:DUF4249 domain-containing protein [Bacteroidia bacterium]